MVSLAFSTQAGMSAVSPAVSSLPQRSRRLISRAVKGRFQLGSRHLELGEKLPVVHVCLIKAISQIGSLILQVVDTSQVRGGTNFRVCGLLNGRDVIVKQRLIVERSLGYRFGEAVYCLAEAFDELLTPARNCGDRRHGCVVA